MHQVLRLHFENIVQLTDNQFDFIMSHFTTRKLKKHQFLIQENQIVNEDFWVAKGLLRAYSTDANGKEHIIQFAKEDWWISDYQAYFNQLQSTINIVCMEETEVFCLSLENREKICLELHKVEHFFRKKSNMGYIALQRRILSLLSSSAKERYEQFLLQYPDLLQRIPKALIASYLGVSRETLSRLI
ncbi:Crp/Fnr family transcriptional regulator [Chryseobacterium sp. FH1]|uniref:Crp/Fnr family transcriptional regulator n=1 Tax=Chryseobacterium sp. FH1 TaxID=1233951 RepID=UPI0004E39B06|nr:Crp/Fnr family transcriptional regulator [Chryseobacterium sp. FH1]KFC20533.1 Crp/Fnr family transcriptional regulator [Chryseobacterium sp. FH1]